MAKMRAAALLLLVTCLAVECRTEASSMPAAFTEAFPRLDTDDLMSENQFERPCADWRPPGGSSGLDLPLCQCSSSTDNGTNINCDRIVFQGDFPLLPFRHRIHGFSQRSAGYQSFPAQLFTASDVPIKRLDMSHNGSVPKWNELFKDEPHRNKWNAIKVHSQLSHLGALTDALWILMKLKIADCVWRHLKCGTCHQTMNKSLNLNAIKFKWKF